LDLCQDFVHFRTSKGSHRFGLNFAIGPEVKQKSGRCFIIGGIENQNAIRISQGPVDIGNFDPQLFAPSLDGRGSLGRF